MHLVVTHLMLTLYAKATTLMPSEKASGARAAISTFDKP